MSTELVKLITGWNKDETSEFYIKPEKFEEEEVKGFKKPLKKKDGVLILNDIINLEMLKTLELKDNDTFIIGFPKSGTTWVEEIVWQIQHDFNYQQAKDVFHFFRIFWVDRGFARIAIEEAEPPRCFKSHVPIKFLPENFNKKAKVIYVVRNPKDVLISAFKFVKAMKETEFMGTLDDFVNLFCEGKLFFGPWWDHLNQYENLENVHIVHYEDLIEKPMETTRALANYLGATHITDEQIKTLLAFVSFDNMKSMPTMDMKAMEDMFKENLDFFSKGKIGTWKEHLTEEQSKKIDEALAKNLTYKRPIQFEPSKKN